MDTLRATHKLDSIAQAVADRPDTSAVRFAATMPGFEWTFAEPGASDQYFVASITKLATTALVFQQVTEGHYDLSTPASALLPHDVTDGIAGLDGTGTRATVEDLLAHTSGVPDYFETAPRGHTTMLERIRTQDLAWTAHEAIESVRGMPGPGNPGDRRRAHYSDTNFQLLQLIIEQQGHRYADAVREQICTPLGLTSTFIYGPDDVAQFGRIAPIMDGAVAFDRPLAMGSFQADGGMVSTTAEQIRMLEAFLSGELFPQHLVQRATAHWRRMFFPLEYGLGTMRFRLPRAMAPLSPMPPFVGHSGASGATLFHDPARRLTIAGSVNQLRKRSMAFQTLGRLERALR